MRVRLIYCNTFDKLIGNKRFFHYIENCNNLYVIENFEFDGKKISKFAKSKYFSKYSMKKFYVIYIDTLIIKKIGKNILQFAIVDCDENCKIILKNNINELIKKYPNLRNLIKQIVIN